MIRPTTGTQTATRRLRPIVAAIRAADIQADAIARHGGAEDAGEKGDRCGFENGDIDGEPTYTRDLSRFAVSQVSDDRPDQGRQRHSIVLAPRKFDLVTIPIPAVLDPAPTTAH